MYQTIIFKHHTNCNINNLYNNLEKTGSLFIFVDNKYNNKWFIESNIFDVLELYVKAGFNYMNTIIYPIKIDEEWIGIKTNVSYIFWFAKDINNIFFNKDVIREKHIWKDIEWGKRKKNYHKLGKDPWNIWIPTIDNWKWHIVEHIIINIEDILNRCIISTFIETN